MDKKELEKLLHEPKEQDWLDFKAKLKLYAADGKSANQPRAEFIKDILGLANGNSHIIRKTKYLIVGVDDKEFDENGMRVLHDVNYKIPSQRELVQWLSGACTPAVVGLECELVPFQGVNLFVITIPPTFDLHETTHELVTPKTFQKHTVFMRQGEHTVPASVREGVTIQQLKHLHRQEIANPSSIWIGAIAGGIVALVFSGALIKGLPTNLSNNDAFMRGVIISAGVFFGGTTGWAAKTLKETFYDWHYMTWRQRISLLIFALMVITILSIMPSLLEG
jgi:hypothetical protein